MHPRTVTLLAGLLLAGPLPPVPAVAAGTPPRAPEIRVRVLEDAWQVGDEKTYTLQFDRAPIGRQAMRLVELRRGDDGRREAVFRQRTTLDLRAVGQEGTFEHAGTILYYPEAAGPYRYEELVSRHPGYRTYRDPDDLRAAVSVALDPGAGRLEVEDGRGERTGGPLPSADDAILVDFLMLAHWERVFAAHPRWVLGETRRLRLLVPSPPARLDFHLPVDGPRPVDPQVLEVALTIEAREEMGLFGARLEAFRCRVDPPGLTLWVSPHGGVLRFDDGRGLTATLEP